VRLALRERWTTGRVGIGRTLEDAEEALLKETAFES
jgi:hypothetical protein